jgi:HAD superfamily hydrolase (TIGR01509 family)
LNQLDFEKIHQADALIFDCDGTLVDSMPIHFLAWHETMTRHGIDFPEDRFYSLGGVPSHHIIAMLASEQEVSIDARAVAIEKERAFLERIHLLEPIHSVVNVAREARGAKPIAIASGGFRDIILKQLQQVSMADWFDTIVTAEDTSKHKPEPDVFLEASRRMNVNPKRCLVFEDADLGVEAARRAGMECIDVRTFYTPKRIPLSQL